jgi:hypothetical protein
MLAWVLALLGIMMSFLVKYIKRNNKEKAWSLVFWAKDNYPELLVSLLSMIILVVIFQKSEFDNTFMNDKFPWIKSLPLDLVAAALAGYLNNALWYAIVKKAKGK